MERDWTFKEEKIYPYRIMAEIKKDTTENRKKIYDKILKYYGDKYTIKVRNGVLFFESKVKGKVPVLKGQRLYLK